jgi:hypothetical protein
MIQAIWKSTGRRSRNDASTVVQFASAFAVGLYLLVGSPISMAQGCGTVNLSPCPGTLPAIWPDRSAALNNATLIFGWNLQPLTDYQMVIVRPDRSVESDVVRTDEEGDLLGDNVRDDGQTWGSPYQYVAAADALGIYQVRAYVFPWSGDLNEPAVTTTTFYHNNFAY